MKIPFQTAPDREMPGGDVSLVPPGSDIATATLPQRTSQEMAQKGQAFFGEVQRSMIEMGLEEERNATMKAYSEVSPKILQKLNDWKSSTIIGSESRYKDLDYKTATAEEMFAAGEEAAKGGGQSLSALDALKNWQKTYQDTVEEYLKGVPDEGVKKRLRNQFLKDEVGFNFDVVKFIKTSQDKDTQTALTGITNTLANKVMTTPGYTVDMMFADTKEAFDSARLEPAVKKELLQKATFVQMHTVLSGMLADPRRSSDALEIWETRKATLEKSMSSTDFASVTKLMETQGKVAKVDKVSTELYEVFGVFKDGEIDKEGAQALQAALVDPVMRKEMNVDLDTAQKVQDRLQHDMLQIEQTKALIQKQDEDKLLEELYSMMASNKRGALRQIQMLSKKEDTSAGFKHQLVIAQNTMESYFATQESRAYTREARAEVKAQKQAREANRVREIEFSLSLDKGVAFSDEQVAQFVAKTGGTRTEYDTLIKKRDEVQGLKNAHNFQADAIKAIERFMGLDAAGKRTPEEVVLLGQYTGTLDMMRRKAGLQIGDPKVMDLVQELLEKAPESKREIPGLGWDVPGTGETRLEIITRQIQKGEKPSFLPKARRTRQGR